MGLRFFLPLMVRTLLLMPVLAVADFLEDGGMASLEEKPNILVILIDDLGYTDLGSYGGNIATPAIDSLADQGVVFANAHVYSSCAPTRASLLTGKDPHRVGLGSQNGVAPPGISTKTPGYKGSLEGDYIGIAKLLKQQGYDTFQVGKWHLGRESAQLPGALGFDRYFTLLDGAASHYDDGYGVGVAVSPSGLAAYIEDGREVSKLPDNFYSTHYYTQWLIDSLGDREGNGKPFFAYLAYTAVHDPLHAPDELVHKYVGEFAQGFESIKNDRIRGLAESGLIARASFPTRWLANTPSWAELTQSEKADTVQRMAVHAAMLDYLDKEVGRLVQFLKDRGQYENTLIVVMSDNGAATVPKTFYARNLEEQQWQDRAYPLDGVVDYGRKGSFATLGTYNAQAVSGPYFGFKTNLHEGGTRVPMIVKVPGRHERAVSGQFVHVSDLYPTFSQYAGADLSAQRNLLGCSLVAILAGNSEAGCREEFGMAYMGWRSYRDGDWKLVFVSKSFGGAGRYALFNLADDPGEVNDISAEYPGKVRELSKKWKGYARDNGVAVVPMDDVNTFFDRAADKFLGLYWGK
ncbi:MAG: sulfatase-like hydrolase/transferase [Pseudomonadota bacterium]|nr:sulfatase-like hydrolase/transferase [Pseudomonadota bacterium]